MPTVITGPEGSTSSCSVEFVTEDAEEDLCKMANVCWRNLFRNPTIAHGYPTSVRQFGEQGLQLTLQMMLLLGQTPWITSFEGSTMLKGFNSLFVPMACPGSSVLWHFLLNQDETRLSYDQGLKATPEAHFLDNAALQSCRHFVGWTQTADVLAGEAHKARNIITMD